ncbi:MAG: ribonuclease J [Bacilli bacterium]|jgi:ribonuclease J
MSQIKIMALGGLNEIGKNMYIIEVDKDIFVFDAGLKRADERLLGIDYIIPNFDYLKDNQKRIKGIFLTHGHDEAIGAVYDIVKEIPALKVYGTKFTLEVLKKELAMEKLPSNNLVEIKPHRKINFQENAIFPVSLTHSVPDTVGYALYTKDGIIFYTGDFTFDWTMDKLYRTDVGKLAYLGKQGVLCLLAESSYADKVGHTSPNHRLADIVKQKLLQQENRLIFVVMSVHLHRIQELLAEVMRTDCKVVIMGKRLQNIIHWAIDMKYLSFDKKRIGDLTNINDQNIVIMVSDEREKPFANIERIVNGYDKYIKLSQSDTVLITEPVIEGMEKTATRIADNIARLGADIITLSAKEHLLYHPSREDLMLMLNLLNPKYYLPVSGEYRFQYANAKAATLVGMDKDNILLKQNGDVVELVDGQLKHNFERVRVDDILIDGKSAGDIGELVLKDREMLRDSGIIIVTTTVDRRTKNILAGPEILTRGFIYVKNNIELIKEIEEIALTVVLDSIDKEKKYVDYNKIRKQMREELGKFLYQETGCKPMIITVVQEV